MNAESRLTNTKTRYGLVARSLHWLVALLIFANFPLGLIANDLPHDTSEALAQKAALFSVHKTIGVAVFCLAVLRILWALTQPHPAPVHPERRFEGFVAALVHWLLYAALVIVPLSGWVEHAALDGFAPILWPLGQGLPFVPKSEGLAAVAGATHWLFTKILFVTVALHILGALKHALIDRDGVLARMVSGAEAGPAGSRGPGAGPALAAGLVLVAAGFGAGMLGASRAPEPAAGAAAPAAGAAPAVAAAPAGTWQVQEGTLGFALAQMGQTVEGRFAGWTAEIAFDETLGTGEVTVQIDTGSLHLAAVTDQAKAPEFFDVAAFPTATFRASIAPAGEAFAATGTLTLRGVEKPVTLPFTLKIEGEQATMAGAVTLDRRDFGMGPSYKDEATVGFATTVKVALTARRAP
jgi:cytochrome b561/polyisoprenoid-binding protein YceI